MTIDTLEDSVRSNGPRRGVPGLLIVFSGGGPAATPLRLGGSALTLGRDCSDGTSIGDPRLSRRHAAISRGPAGWTVRDLDSRNGTSVDGKLATGPVTCAHPPVLRLGRTVGLAVDDVLPFAVALPMRDRGFVHGPASRAAFAEIAAAATANLDLLLVGESGCGKELAARHFHQAGSRAQGPFIAVNCAAIPAGIAERLLFGTLKGAYSGASEEAQGYVRSAHGGVLFLDEFGELDLDVQAKLLRVIETKEALPVGASRGRVVDVSFCLATNRDLRAAVSSGRFRSDLYYRVSRSEVSLPPLRERRDEIPWLIQLGAESEGPNQEIEAELVEACMLRPWPGNVRELLGEIRRIARMARANATSIRLGLLAARAGQTVETMTPPPAARRAPITAEAVVQALRTATSVSAAAHSLRIHRSHLYRLIRQFGIDVRAVLPSTSD
jgi:DNA-binding NtrC family response regulator